MVIREDNFIKIDNKYIKDNDYILTEKELVILSLININLTVKNDCIFTIGHFMNMLGYSNNNKKIFSDIKMVLSNMQEDNIIKLYINRQTKELLSRESIMNLSKNEFIYCDATDLNNLKDNFTLLYDDELYELLKIANENNVDKFQLIQLVLFILSYMNNNEDISNEQEYLMCYPSFKSIEEYIGLSQYTIEKYINILKKNEILYCDYAGYSVYANGSVKNTKMYYCRYKDKERVVNKINEERKSGVISYSKLNRDKGNIKRKIKQTINKLVSKEEELTKEELIKLNMLNEEYKNIQ